MSDAPRMQTGWIMGVEEIASIFSRKYTFILMKSTIVAYVMCLAAGQLFHATEECSDPNAALEHHWVALSSLPEHVRTQILALRVGMTRAMVEELAEKQWQWPRDGGLFYPL